MVVVRFNGDVTTAPGTAVAGRAALPAQARRPGAAERSYCSQGVLLSPEKLTPAGKRALARSAGAGAGRRSAAARAAYVALVLLAGGLCALAQQPPPPSAPPPPNPPSPPPPRPPPPSPPSPAAVLSIVKTQVCVVQPTSRARELTLVLCICAQTGNSLAPCTQVTDSGNSL